MVAEKKSFYDILDVYNINIPLIQRDYVYGVDDEKIKLIRNRLLNRLIACLTEKGNRPVDLGFVFGATKNNSEFEPLDGQQRLTTLWLIANILYCKLDKEERKNDFQRLKNFNYQVRITTEKFCDFLKDHVFDLKEDYDKENNVINKAFKMVEDKEGLIKKILEAHSGNNDTQDLQGLIKELNELYNIDFQFENIKSELEHIENHEDKANSMKQYIFKQMIRDNNGYHFDFDSDVNAISMIGIMYEIIQTLVNNDIHEDTFIKSIYSNLKDADFIFFYFMPIKDVENYEQDEKNGEEAETYLLNKDDVYLKLNARGLPLTSFENFKAQLISHIKGNNINLIEKIKSSHKINELLNGFSGNKVFKDTDELKKFLIEEIESKLDIELEDRIYISIKNNNQSDSKRTIGSLIDEKRMNIIMNMFLYLATRYISDLHSRDLILSFKYCVRKCYKKLISISDTQFPFVFEKYVEIINDNLSLKEEKAASNNSMQYADFFVETALIYLLYWYEKVKNSSNYFNELSDSFKQGYVDIINLISYNSFIFDDGDLNNIDKYKHFILNLTDDLNLNGEQEFVNYEEIMRKMNETSSKHNSIYANFENYIINVNFEDAKDAFSFNQVFDANFLDECFKYKFKNSMDVYNNKNNVKLDAKVVLGKFEKDYGRHYAFVFEYLKFVDIKKKHLSKKKEKFWFEFDADGFVNQCIDKKTSDLESNTDNKYIELSKFISKNNDSPLTLDKSKVKDLVQYGYIMHKSADEKNDIVYFVNNNSYGDNKRSFDFIMRNYSLEYSYNLRQKIYNAINQNNILFNTSNISISDRDFIKRVLIEHSNFLNSNTDFTYKIKTENNKYYYLMTTKSNFNGICFDLYLSIVKYELEQNNSLKVSYEGFKGESFWSIPDNCVELTYNGKKNNGKKIKISLTKDLTKFELTGATTCSVDIVDGQGSINIVDIEAEIKKVWQI